jgi:small-conductance mechanosensitive channel
MSSDQRAKRFKEFSQMSTNTFRRALFVSCILLILLALVGAVLTRYWINSVEPPETAQGKTETVVLVDQQPLITAQKLAAQATTLEGQEFAQNAVRLADHEVDLAFAAALHQATEHAPPIPAAARPILARVQSLQAKVQTEQKEASRLKEAVAKADENRKPLLEQNLQLAAATMELDEEDLEAARQELIRAGGDPRAKIQQLLDQHEGLDHEHTGVVAAGAPSAKTAAPPEPDSRTFMVQLRAWSQWKAREKALQAARDELQVRQTELAQEHQKLDEETREEGTKGSQQKALSPPPNAASDAHEATPTATAPDIYTTLKQAAGERKHLAELDKRAADFQQLAAIYGQWETLVTARKQGHLKGVVEGACWIVVLLLLVLFAGPLVRSMVARMAPGSRSRHTVRPVARVAVQVAGVVLILLVLFGPPSQPATVLALAGAGLTVALKDFIVGFFGWFILMGPNGIRPGDWVEINGIGGEVVEVGLLHTVILETGDWSDAGHPTGRKVTFVNSFAIEGHYFNFSTTGQWLWDEVEVPIPAGVDPYPIAEAVHKKVVTETETNVQLAEQEWERAVPGHVGRTFAPVPAIMVRPTTLGVNVIVRYITRAHERHELRSRIFHKIVDLLRSSQFAVSLPENAAAKSTAE